MGVKISKRIPLKTGAAVLHAVFLQQRIAPADGAFFKDVLHTHQIVGMGQYPPDDARAG